MKQNVLWWGHLVWVHVFEELAAQSLLGCTAFAGIQVQHVVEQVQGRRRDAGQQKHKNYVYYSFNYPSCLYCRSWAAVVRHRINKVVSISSYNALLVGPALEYSIRQHILTKQTPLVSVSCTVSLVSWCWRRGVWWHLATQQDMGCHIFGWKTEYYLFK